MNSFSLLNLDLGGFLFFFFSFSFVFVFSGFLVLYSTHRDIGVICNGVNASLAAFADCIFLSIVVENLYATLRWGGNLLFTDVRVFIV